MARLIMESAFVDKKYNNKEWLENQYINLGKSCHRIAKEIGVGKTTVNRYCKRFNIPFRKQPAAFAWASELPKERLISLYVDDELFDYQIGEMFGVSDVSIGKLRKKYGIESRSIGETIHLSRGNNVDLSDIAIEFIHGELLGDGSLEKRSDWSAQYRHSTTYREYLEWLSAVMEKFGVYISGNLRMNDTEGIITHYYSSLSYSEFINMYNKWYERDISGKMLKIVPRDLKLTPLMMRQWYIGDGGLMFRKKNKTAAIKLCTNGFRKDDVLFLKSLLLDFDIHANRHAENILYIKVGEVDKFLSIIGDCPEEIESIYGYKWCPHQRKVDWQSKELK